MEWILVFVYFFFTFRSFAGVRLFGSNDFRKPRAVRHIQLLCRYKIVHFPAFSTLAFYEIFWSENSLLSRRFMERKKKTHRDLRKTATRRRKKNRTKTLVSSIVHHLSHINSRATAIIFSLATILCQTSAIYKGLKLSWKKQRIYFGWLLYQPTKATNPILHNNSAECARTIMHFNETRKKKKRQQQKQQEKKTHTHIELNEGLHSLIVVTNALNATQNETLNMLVFVLIHTADHSNGTRHH